MTPSTNEPEMLTTARSPRDTRHQAVDQVARDTHRARPRSGTRPTPHRSCPHHLPSGRETEPRRRDAHDEARDDVREATPTWPSFTSTSVSTLNVENVVYAPRMPVPANARAYRDGGISLDEHPQQRPEHERPRDVGPERRPREPARGHMDPGRELVPSGRPDHRPDRDGGQHARTSEPTNLDVRIERKVLPVVGHPASDSTAAGSDFSSSRRPLRRSACHDLAVRHHDRERAIRLQLHVPQVTVQLGVVPDADWQQVVEIGAPTVAPPHDVMGLAVAKRHGTVGHRTPRVQPA